MKDVKPDTGPRDTLPQTPVKNVVQGDNMSCPKTPPVAKG